MTPLAAYLAKQTIARPKHREGIWRDPQVIPDLRKRLEDIHCFEVSACWDLILQTMKHTSFARAFDTFGFLPAPNTWLEWTVPGAPRDRNRRAVLLNEYPDPVEDEEGVVREAVGVNLFEHHRAIGIGFLIPKTGSFQLEEEALRNWRLVDRDPLHAASALMGITQTILVLINSPRIIGRRQYMPNRALERELTRGFGRGKFPLHAWTEIKLEVAKPPEIDDGEPHEAHLTGRRALHFCRKHIRIRNGQLEYVSAHWRGDPALGIKRARYRVSA